MTTTSGDAVIDRLGRFGSIPEWLAAPMQPERVAASLRAHVPELAQRHVEITHCSPDRLRAKGTQWLARYTVRVLRPGDGEERDVVLVGNLWGPLSEPPVITTTTHPVPFGHVDWSAWLPDLRLTLRTQITDEALPALPALVDPPSVTRMLQPILRDAGYRDASIAACEPVVVRYKPGSRCTVVVRLSYTSSDPRLPSPVVVKTHQGDKGETAWAAMRALWERAPAWQDALRLAEPLGYLPEERILVQGPVPEECTLKDLARRAITAGDATLLARLREELAKAARALAAVHGSGASYGRTATFSEEIAEVREVVDRLALSVPELTQAADPLLRLLTERARSEEANPVVPAHHDFRPAQVLLHSGGVGFIDFDGACMAEPALDLGRFRAKLRDIGISAGNTAGTELDVDDRLNLLDELCEHFLAAYQEQAAVSRGRVLLWESCDLLTTMLHAWTKVRLARLQPRLTTLLHHLRTSGLASEGETDERPRGL